jgi:hypothetical protein
VPRLTDILKDWNINQVSIDAKEVAETEWNLNHVQPPENSFMVCHIAVRFRKARLRAT